MQAAWGGVFQLRTAVIPYLLLPVTPRRTHYSFHSAHGDPISVGHRSPLLSATQAQPRWGGTHRYDGLWPGWLAGIPFLMSIGPRTQVYCLRPPSVPRSCPQDTSSSRGASHCGSKPREERDPAKWGAAVLFVITWSWTHPLYPVLPGRCCPPHTAESSTGHNLREVESGGHLQNVHMAILEFVNR